MAGDFVFIGGLSRSGKSNFSSALKDFLRLNGINSVLISVDRWLRNYEEREAGVHGRYHMQELKSLIKILSKRDKKIQLSLPSYNKITRTSIKNTDEIVIDPLDVVIIEGTIALNLIHEINRGRAHGWFVQIDERERHDRVLNEYRLRGLKNSEAEDLYQMREIDETPIIQMTSKHAHHKIYLEMIGNVR